MGWAVMDEVPEYVGKMVGRLVTDVPSGYMLVADSLADLRAQLPPNLNRLDRRPTDPPNLWELWLG